MSSSFEQWLSLAQKRYLEAKDLSENLSLRDSLENPFKSKYKSKEILEELSQQLSEFGSEMITTNVINQKLLVQLLLEYEMGSIDLDTEETPNSEKHFEFCLKIINDLIICGNIEPQRVDVSLSLFKVLVNNQMAFIWCSRSQYSKAETYLKSAENSYKNWEKSKEILKNYLIDFLDVFLSNPLNETKVNKTSKEDRNRVLKSLESGHTLTTYLLAQIYEKIGENSKSAAYCHLTLKRQYNDLEDNTNQMLDRIDWSLNAGTLSQYFANNKDFKTARHLICCALKVINKTSDESEKQRKGFADINRICVKYCQMLLESSVSPVSDNLIIDSQQNTFGSLLLNDSEVEELEKSIPMFPITNLSEAQKVFKYGINCLNEAIGFYTLDERASDYMECIQDKSKLFQYLIPFDNDIERQCKMHKRRIDLLEELLKQISPKHFMGQCRQIMFELAEIYSQMADLKNQLKDKKGERQMSAIKKINGLIQKSISNYIDFQKTFYDNLNELPQNLPQEYIRPILLSQFSIGRLNSKLISFDPREELKNWSKCEENYHKIRDYLERNPEHKSHFEEELPLLEEMLKLIPGKMQMILSSTVF